MSIDGGAWVGGFLGGYGIFLSRRRKTSGMTVVMAGEGTRVLVFLSTYLLIVSSMWLFLFLLLSIFYFLLR